MVAQNLLYPPRLWTLQLAGGKNLNLKEKEKLSLYGEDTNQFAISIEAKEWFYTAKEEHYINIRKDLLKRF